MKCSYCDKETETIYKDIYRCYNHYYIVAYYGEYLSSSELEVISIEDEAYIIELHYLTNETKIFKRTGKIDHEYPITINSLLKIDPNKDMKNLIKTINNFQ